MSKSLVLRQDTWRMPQLDQSFFTLYVNEATRMILFGEQNVLKLYERKAPRE